MPIYTCTVTESTFSADTKRALAGEIARIHSSIDPRAEHICECRLSRVGGRRSVRRRRTGEPGAGHRLGA